MAKKSKIYQNPLQDIFHFENVYYFGCEAEVVVLVMKYEDICLEFLSRARRQLVILTQDLGDKREMLVSATDKEGNNIFNFD